MDRLPTWDDVNHYHRIGDEATRELAAARHALEKIQELHEHDYFLDECEHCGKGWPCPTIRIAREGSA